MPMICRVSNPLGDVSPNPPCLSVQKGMRYICQSLVSSRFRPYESKQAVSGGAVGLMSQMPPLGSVFTSEITTRTTLGFGERFFAHKTRPVYALTSYGFPAATSAPNPD